MDGQAIAHNILKALWEYGIVRRLADLRVYVMDRAGTNGKEIKELRSNNLARSHFCPCHSHTINLPGKEFSISFQDMNDLRKYWNTRIQTSGQMFNK